MVWGAQFSSGINGLAQPLSAVAVLVAVLAGLTPSAAEAQVSREIESVIIEQSAIIRRYTPPPMRGMFTLDVRAYLEDDTILDRVIVLRSVEVTNVSLVPVAVVEAVYAGEVGQRTTVRKALEIAAAIEAVYRRAGYLVVAAVSREGLGEGVLRIRVVEESYIEQVEIDGVSPATEARLQPYVRRIVEMVPLRVLELERVLLLMTDIAGFAVDATLVRPERLDRGGSLTLQIAFVPTTAAVKIDNRGSEQIGPLQAGVFASFNDVFGLFENTTLTAATVPNAPRELAVLQLSQTAPVLYDGLRYSHTLSLSRVQPGADLRPLGVKIDTVATEMALSYPVLRTIDNSVHAQISFATRHTSTDILGTRVGSDTYRWAGVGLSSDHTLAFGAVSISAEALQGLGASPDFQLVRGEASLTVPFAERFAFTGRAKGQYAASALPGAVRFEAGGDRYGRAFTTAAISGDSGVAGSAELAISNIINYGFVPSSSLFVFLDGATAWTRVRAADSRAESIVSVGLGARLVLDPGVMGELVLAVPIATEGIEDKGLAVFFSVGKQF